MDGESWRNEALGQVFRNELKMLQNDNTAPFTIPSQKGKGGYEIPNQKPQFYSKIVDRVDQVLRQSSNSPNFRSKFQPTPAQASSVNPKQAPASRTNYSSPKTQKESEPRVTRTTDEKLRRIRQENEELTKRLQFLRMKNSNPKNSRSPERPEKPKQKRETGCPKNSGWGHQCIPRPLNLDKLAMREEETVISMASPESGKTSLSTSYVQGKKQTEESNESSMVATPASSTGGGHMNGGSTNPVPIDSFPSTLISGNPSYLTNASSTAQNQNDGKRISDVVAPPQKHVIFQEPVFCYTERDTPEKTPKHRKYEAGNDNESHYHPSNGQAPIDVDEEEEKYSLIRKTGEANDIHKEKAREERERLLSFYQSGPGFNFPVEKGVQRERSGPSGPSFDYMFRNLVNRAKTPEPSKVPPKRNFEMEINEIKNEVQKYSENFQKLAANNQVSGGAFEKESQNDKEKSNAGKASKSPFKYIEKSSSGMEKRIIIQGKQESEKQTGKNPERPNDKVYRNREERQANMKPSKSPIKSEKEGNLQKKVAPVLGGTRIMKKEAFKPNSSKGFQCASSKGHLGSSSQSRPGNEKMMGSPVQSSKNFHKETPKTLDTLEGSEKQGLIEVMNEAISFEDAKSILISVQLIISSILMKLTLFLR